jgi:hypothetical protein
MNPELVDLVVCLEFVVVIIAILSCGGILYHRLRRRLGWDKPTVGEFRGRKYEDKDDYRKWEKHTRGKM